MIRALRTALVTLCIAFLAVPAMAVTIDFNTDDDGAPIVLGQIIDDEYADLGLSVFVSNDGGPPNFGVAFDSGMETGQDQDLTVPYSGGNAENEDYGNLLIIQEDGSDDDENGILDDEPGLGRPDPDDQGLRNPGAGTMFFAFTDSVEITNVALIDIEGIEEYQNGRGFLAGFDMLGGTELWNIPFSDLANRPGVSFGNRSANEFSIDEAPVGLFVVDLGGSGALGEFQFERRIPVPGPAALLGAGLLAFGLSRLRRGRKS